MLPIGTWPLTSAESSLQEALENRWGGPDISRVSDSIIMLFPVFYLCVAFQGSQPAKPSINFRTDMEFFIFVVHPPTEFEAHAN